MPDGHWHFQCPECGFGDREIGRFAVDEELTCEVCLEEGGRTVRLERWQPQEAIPTYARLRGALAA
jgi:hypothetical protein